MAGTDLTGALARLLSDRVLRADFANRPEDIARRFALTPNDHAILVAMDPAALEQQARGLLEKRRGEVARLLPRTWRLLGQMAPAWFDEYASAHWPSGHLRHPHDALRFLRFLAARRLLHDRLEAIRLDARLAGRFSIAFLRRAGAWGLPGLYVTWHSREGWHERMFRLGPGT